MADRYRGCAGLTASSALNRGGKQVVKKVHFGLNFDRINTIYRILFNISLRNLVDLVNPVYFTHTINGFSFC